MKKLLSVPLVILLAFVLNATAQTSKKDFRISAVEEKNSPVNAESKPYKNFRRSYPDVDDEKWSVQKKHFFATFKKDDVVNKIVYNSAGRVDYILKIYDETHLPSEVRSAVKSIYYDFAITNAQQLDVRKNVIYLVKITDGVSWKTVRVNNGNVEEIEHYVNSISPCR